MARSRTSRALIGAAALVVALAGCSAYGASGTDQSTQPATPSPTAATTTTTPSPTAASTSPTPAPKPKQSAKPKPKPKPTKTTEPALLAQGDQGDKVRELQARLKQIAWFSPKITGEYGEVTTQAVKGFQAKRGFTASGEVDQRTWDRLLEMTRMPTDDEMHNRIVAGPTILGPGDEGDKVRELQARLKQIAWFHGDVTPYYGDITKAAVAGFQTKRGFPSTGEVDQRTWDRLVGMTRTPTDDELHNRSAAPASGQNSSAGLDPRCLTGRAMCIDKSTSTLRWVVDGTVKQTLDVRFGAEYSPTREGLFHVGWKDSDHVSKLYGSAMPYSMFFSGGQAVHYSSDFAARGYSGASHGCVNVRDYDGVAWLYSQVNVGDKVVVYWS